MAKNFLIFPTSVILDFQHVILHKTWVLTKPNMLVLQFILGSSYIWVFSTRLLWQWWKIDLQKIKFEMKSDAGVWGRGVSCNNVMIFLQLTELANSMVFAVLFRKFTCWPYSLKEENCGQRFSRLCGFWRFPWKFMSMKFVKICHPRKFISAKLFKTGYQQKFMSARFSKFCNCSSDMLKFWKFRCRR